MSGMDSCWEETLSQRLKLERNLNFSTLPHEDDDFGYSRKKATRDPMSHRIIEKRRRDRMNNCLADLSRLIPNTYLKKGRGRIEKTEIIEMAIRHLKHLQAHSCKDPNNCEVMKSAEHDQKRHYRLGFQECMSETLRFLVEIEGLFSGDGVCLRLVNHLQKHYEKAAGGLPYTGNATTVLEHPYEENRGIAMEVEGPSLPHQTQYDECVSSTGASNRVSPVPASNIAIKPKDNYFTKEHIIRDNHLKAGTLCENSGKYKCEDTLNNGISQLREMLQNPSVPIERIRSNSLSNSHIVTQSNSLPWMATLPPGVPIYTTSVSHKTEEVYKYKNNMKERFNADLHYYTCSPTNERKCYDEKQRCSETVLDNAVTYSPSSVNPSASNFEIKTNPPIDYNSEVYSKVPPHNGQESSRTANQGWDHAGDSSSSCGSNSSPPMVGRSNGSSSGYSTGGEMPFTPKYKSQQTNSSSESVLYTENNSATENLQTQSTSSQCVTHNSSVPIFALHPKGTFYIPLTIDATVIANDLVAFDSTLPLLHPVSISVNFCQSLKFLNKWQRHAYVPEIFEEGCNSGERTAYATDGHN